MTFLITRRTKSTVKTVRAKFYICETMLNSPKRIWKVRKRW